MGAADHFSSTIVNNGARPVTSDVLHLPLAVTARTEVLILVMKPYSREVFSRLPMLYLHSFFLAPENATPGF